MCIQYIFIKLTPTTPLHSFKLFILLLKPFFQWSAPTFLSLILVTYWVQFGLLVEVWAIYQWLHHLGKWLCHTEKLLISKSPSLMQVGELRGPFWFRPCAVWHSCCKSLSAVARSCAEDTVSYPPHIHTPFYGPIPYAEKLGFKYLF